MSDNKENKKIDTSDDINNPNEMNTENDITPDLVDFSDDENFLYDDFGDKDDFSDDESSFPLSENEEFSELEQVNIKKSEFFKTAMKKHKKTIIITLCILFITCLALYVTGIATLPHNTVMNNVYVEDIYVGGMTYDEVLKTMEKTFLLENQKIIVNCNGKQAIINGNDIGMAANPIDTAKKVYNYGKSGNLLADGFKNALRLVKKRVVIPVAEINQELLANKINEFGIQIFGEMIGHYVEINEIDTTATIWPGHTGYNPNDDKSYQEACKIVTEAISKDKYNIYLPLSVSSPPELTMQIFDGLVYTDPQNAQYKVENNTVEIVPEKTGRYINKEEAATLLPLVKEGGEVIKIPYYVSYADITSQMLSDKLFSHTLASYSTNYGGSTANRAANVARAAELINGKVLSPGEIFSFNDTVGDRTVSNGFYTATEYVDGKSVQGIGGGTCQVSTTLYSAALYADLQIVHRENHVMTVGYVPLGQDATVAYGSVDFKFKNTTEYPIKIVATTGGGTITVSIVGTNWEPARTVELKHSTTYIGEDTSVTSTRYVYENGTLISTDPLGKSYYKPHKEEEETPTSAPAFSQESSDAEPSSQSTSQPTSTQAEVLETPESDTENTETQEDTTTESNDDNS